MQGNYQTPEVKRRKIYVTVGVAGSGKSTWAQEQDNVKIFSSDQQRLKLFGELAQHDNKRVFEILYDGLDLYLRNHSSKNVIVDATNLSRKKRIAFYQRFSKYGEVVIQYFVRSLEELRLHNEARPIEEQVPEHIIKKMYCSQEIPRLDVDCDRIQVEVSPETREKLKKEYILNEEVPHDSPYHSETIQAHIKSAVTASQNFPVKVDVFKYMLCQLAWYHDLGKFVAKSPAPKTPATEYFRSVSSGKCDRYIGHENISAMYFLSTLPKDSRDWSSRDAAVLEMIFQHMNAHRGFSEKMIDRHRLTPMELDLLEVFVLIDDMATVPNTTILEQYLALQGRGNTQQPERIKL